MFRKSFVFLVVVMAAAAAHAAQPAVFVRMLIAEYPGIDGNRVLYTAEFNGKPSEWQTHASQQLMENLLQAGGYTEIRKTEGPTVKDKSVTVHFVYRKLDHHAQIPMVTLKDQHARGAGYEVVFSAKPSEKDLETAGRAIEIFDQSVRESMWGKEIKASHETKLVSEWPWKYTVRTAFEGGDLRFMKGLTASL